MFLPGFSAPVVMGVINMSPNSFMNPQKNLDAALATVDGMVFAGASFIDVGGEATSPSVDMVKEAPSISAEIDRVLPVIEAIKNRFDILVSVDTSEPQVMAEAIAVGVDLINIQQVRKNPEALPLIAKTDAMLCLMHFFTPTRTPNSSNLPELLIQIKDELNEMVKLAWNEGISRERIILDPGFGGGNYGKNTEENFYLLAHLEEFFKMGFPLLTGWSRKSMLGEVLGKVPPKDRLFASLAAEAILALKGAAIIRTHDVKPVCDMLKVINYYNEVSSI